MTIRPDNADDYDGLLRAAARQGSVVDGIVHLWSLDAADPEKADLKAVQASPDAWTGERPAHGASARPRSANERLPSCG